MLVPTNAWVSRLAGQRVGSCQLFCSWRSPPKIHVPPVHVLRLVNETPSHTPQAFFKLLVSMLSVWTGGFCYAVLRVQTQFPITLRLSRAKPTDFFKYPELRLTNCKNS